MLSWLESCDGVNIRRCIQSLGTNTCTYYTNILGCELPEDGDQSKHAAPR